MNIYIYNKLMKLDSSWKRCYRWQEYGSYSTEWKNAYYLWM